MSRRLFLAILCSIYLSNICFADEIESVLDGYYGNNTTYHSTSFSDISEPIWAAEAIEYLAKYGIVSGSDGRFNPNNNITREQFVKMLILGFGLYDEYALCNYTDVPKDSWYYGYVATATKLGITSGINDEKFGTGQHITREQMVTLFYNTSKICGVSFEKANDKTFADEKEIDTYAVEAADALLKSGIISGDENGNFNPQNYATRAETCKLIYPVIKRLL